MMDGTSDRSATYQTEDLLPPCCLEEDPRMQRRRLPMAEICMVGSVLCGFLIITGVTMVALHYTVETSAGFHSVSEHYGISTHILGLSLVALAGALFLATLFVYAVVKVSEVVEMAHRYQEHREFCVYEDLRQSFRSQQSERCATVELGRYSNADSKDTPRK